MALIAGCDRQADRSVPLQPKAAPQASHGGVDAPADGVRLALLEPGGDTDLARLEGILQVDGRCLYIVGNDKAKDRTLPAFALAGVRWDSDSQTLKVGNKMFPAGQRIVLGGGEPADPAALNWSQRPDPSCDASAMFVVGHRRLRVTHLAREAPGLDQTQFDKAVALASRQRALLLRAANPSTDRKAPFARMA